MQRSSILVVGGTGFVGRALVAECAERALSVRVASRKRGELEPGVQWIRCDVERPEDLPAALEGIDVAYYLVHRMGGRNGAFHERDRTAAHNFAHAIAQSSCRRVIYLGGVAPLGKPSRHLASRLEVGEIMRAGPVPALELRASMIVGNGSASWQIVRDLASRLPFMVLPRWLDSKSCPIALPDVITALLAARDVPLPSSAWFDLPGPEVLSMREMLETVARLEGRRIPSVRVPVLTPSLSAMWLRLISGADYALARELVLGLTGDLLPQHSFWEQLGRGPRWSFRAAAEDALASEAPPAGFAAVLERLVRRFGLQASRA